MSSKGKVLFVLTSHDKLLDGKSATGWYLPEAAHPYYELMNAGYHVDFASPKGGKAPLDQDSVKFFSEDQACTKFLNDKNAQQSVNNTLKLSTIDPGLYKLIFYVGGNGPMFDLVEDKASIDLAQKFWASGKVVSAICHGPAALVNVKDQNGIPIVSGRNVTSLSDEEETLEKKVDQVPFLLETKLKEIGGKYSKNPKAYGPHVVVDGQLITGGNPASGAGVGKALLKSLEG